MGTRLTAILTAVHRAPDGLVSLVVQHEIGMSAGAGKPALNPGLLLLNGCAYRVFRYIPVGVGRGGRNVALAPQSFLQLRVGAPDMLAQDVTARSFVAAEIT
jgi:hypothetical protein